ncbi:MAG: hypothetical protein IH845_05195 [Nanoarchaeota archaeon]|nr:hypothetical protein [Nanoarchaeota archaeon]
MKCQFCKKEEGIISITDGETQQEVLICNDCNDLMYFDIPKRIKEIDGYKDFTIQELEYKIDEMIESEVEELKIKND